MIGMRVRPAAICGLALFNFSFACVVSAATGEQCQPPSSLGEELSKRIPDTRIVTAADLEEYDFKLFQKVPGTRCPGLVKVNSFGDGQPTWALVLVPGENPKRKAHLVVAPLV